MNVGVVISKDWAFGIEAEKHELPDAETGTGV